MCVRPANYSKGHISSAINIPLFSDDERAKVEILLYTKG